MSANHPLRRWRSKQGLSLREFAEQIAVTKGTVSRYESGRRRPEWAVLDRIVKATRGAVTADDFMSEAAE